MSTGLPEAVRQPLRFHPGIHLVTESITYRLSHSISSFSSVPAVAKTRAPCRHAIWIAACPTPLPAPSPYTITLVSNVRRLKLDVAKVAHVHGGVDAYERVVRDAGM